MSDILTLGNIADKSAGSGSGTVRDGDNLNTGVLRRKYNFGDKVSELLIDQDPFFRFVSMLSKKPTDDPNFKFTERRGSFHKRYVYVNGTTATYGVDGGSNAVENTTSNKVYLQCYSDMDNSGNLQNIYGQTSQTHAGDSHAQPEFLIPGQVLKVNTNTAADQSTANGYQLVKIDSVDLDTSGYAKVEGTIVKPSGASASTVYFLNNDITGISATGTTPSTESLEPYRNYVVGTGFEVGSGYPETWDDQPFSTGYGQTQIWKTTMAMNNTDRATSLKYEGNEWARIWKEKLVEHKWDIEQSLLFGRQASSGSVNYTQGAVDFISTYGNAFSLDINSKTQDDFLDDLSTYLDPRYNNGKATVFFTNTAVWNWLHKLGGYFNNNLSIGSNFRADFAVMGKKSVLGLNATTISTPYGDMNIVRNVHLDGTNVKLLGINMKYCSYRPLVGNGINRDTSVYVGVQTLENSGVDRRVDQILTEAGMEWQMPECHAVWTN